MASPEHLKANRSHPVMEFRTTAAHRCLFISEILRLIFEFIWLWDEDPRQRDADDDAIGWEMRATRQSSDRDGKKTLATLARTCRLFSGVALDFLWRDLNSLDPLLTINLTRETSMDETDLSSFRKYAKRVRSIQIQDHDTLAPALANQILIALHECHTRDRLLFPNLTEFDWGETTIGKPNNSRVPLFKHFAGPALTTLVLSVSASFVCPSASELAILSDLPNLCPNVTSFAIFFRRPWIYGFDYSRLVGAMASQWKRLRSLRSCAIPQSDMEKLTSQRTLETLGIEIIPPTPVHMGTVPDTVQKLLLNSRSITLCRLYVENVHASPTICRLSIDMYGFNRSVFTALVRLLPCRLDTSRLECLMIKTRTVSSRSPLSGVPGLRGRHIQVLTQFTLLRELDLDQFCASQLDNAAYLWIAILLPYLCHLKIGTARPSSVVDPCPAATVAAVTAIVTYCHDLETLCITFDGTASPLPSLTQSAFGPGESCHERLGGHEPGKWSRALCSAVAGEGWGVPNKYITTLHIGHSPIADANVSALASCLKLLMPNLRQIQHHTLDERWDMVQNLLTS